MSSPKLPPRLQELIDDKQEERVLSLGERVPETGGRVWYLQACVIG